MTSPTRLIMSTSALLLGIMGMAATFAPREILGSLGVAPMVITQLMVQILGALYLGFASMNWMMRDGIIGGIYNRPVVIGNLTHFLVAAMAMLRVVTDSPSGRSLWPVAVVYAGYTLAFGVLLFRHPVKDAP